MVEKGSPLLEIKGAAFFVWDRKRWCWNKIKPDTCRCVQFLISELSTHSATGAKVLAPATKGRYRHYLINLISIIRHSAAKRGVFLSPDRAVAGFYNNWRRSPPPPAVSLISSIWHLFSTDVQTFPHCDDFEFQV